MARISHDEAQKALGSNDVMPASAHALLCDYIEQQRAAEANTVSKSLWGELCEQVAQMCEYLGSKREEVPCDSWHLRDLIVKLKSDKAVLETKLRELEVKP